MAAAGSPPPPLQTLRAADLGWRGGRTPAAPPRSGPPSLPLRVCGEGLPGHLTTGPPPAHLVPRRAPRGRCQTPPTLRCWHRRVTGREPRGTARAPLLPPAATVRGWPSTVVVGAPSARCRGRRRPAVGRGVDSGRRSCRRGPSAPAGTPPRPPPSSATARSASRRARPPPRLCSPPTKRDDPTNAVVVVVGLDQGIPHSRGSGTPHRTSGVQHAPAPNGAAAPPSAEVGGPRWPVRAVTCLCLLVARFGGWRRRVCWSEAVSKSMRPDRGGRRCLAGGRVPPGFDADPAPGGCRVTWQISNCITWPTTSTRGPSRGVRGRGQTPLEEIGDENLDELTELNSYILVL